MNSYVVTCPDCRGRMFADGVLCGTCQGNGRLLIPERTEYHYTAKRALRITLLAAIAILVIAVWAASR